jgi:hypothetical protein
LSLVRAQPFQPIYVEQEASGRSFQSPPVSAANARAVNAIAKLGSRALV